MPGGNEIMRKQVKKRNGPRRGQKIEDGAKPRPDPRYSNSRRPAARVNVRTTSTTHRPVQKRPKKAESKAKKNREKSSGKARIANIGHTVKHPHRAGRPIPPPARQNRTIKGRSTWHSYSHTFEHSTKSIHERFPQTTSSHSSFGRVGKRTTTPSSPPPVQTCPHPRRLPRRLRSQRIRRRLLFNRGRAPRTTHRHPYTQCFFSKSRVKYLCNDIDPNRRSWHGHVIGSQSKQSLGLAKSGTIVWVDVFKPGPQLV